MNKKKVLIVLGSPRRKGNSSILAQQFIKGLKKQNMQIDTIFLEEMKISSCKACNACMKNTASGCINKDKMQDLYPKIIDADIMVLASPIYWFNMSSQMKIFIDRFYGLLKNNRDSFRSKKIIILLAYGDSTVKSSGALNAINSFQNMFDYLGSEIMAILHGSAANIGDIEDNKELMNKVYQLGVQISS